MCRLEDRLTINSLFIFSKNAIIHGVYRLIIIQLEVRVGLPLAIRVYVAAPSRMQNSLLDIVVWSVSFPR